MNYFLAKTDPESYSIDQLQAERQTVWDGVRNPQAIATIRSMRKGDHVFIYHSMTDPAVVGMAKVISDPRPDPKDAKLAVVDLEFLFRFDPPATLREIKELGSFSGWTLVRQGRLSTMAAPEEFVIWMRERYPRLKI